MKRNLMLAAVLFAASFAAAMLAPRSGSTFPNAYRNNWERSSGYVVMDSVLVPAAGRRSLYNIVPTNETGARAPIDSLVGLWQSSGTAPTFRRVQHLQLWPNAGQQVVTVTLFNDSGTSRNTFILDNFVVYDLRVEADSIQLSNATGSPVNLNYVLW